MRISRPVRSTQCSHVQCFDATWWIESNAQHPQFICPLCNKALNFDNLIVDGYFQSILDAVPESVEEVVVESDYEWHTEDDKYASEGWRKDHPLPGAAQTNGHAPSAAPSDGAANGTPAADSPGTDVIKGKRKAIEILSSDDEDDDAPLSRNRTNGFASMGLPHAGQRSASYSAAPSFTSTNNAVIDLTIDSSDDETDDEASRPAPAVPAPTSAPPAKAYFRQPGVSTSSHSVESTQPRPLPHAPAHASAYPPSASRLGHAEIPANARLDSLKGSTSTSALASTSAQASASTKAPASTTAASNSNTGVRINPHSANSSFSYRPNSHSLPRSGSNTHLNPISPIAIPELPRPSPVQRMFPPAQYRRSSSSTDSESHLPPRPASATSAASGRSAGNTPTNQSRSRPLSPVLGKTVPVSGVPPRPGSGLGFATYAESETRLSPLPSSSMDPPDDFRNRTTKHTRPNQPNQSRGLISAGGKRRSPLSNQSSPVSPIHSSALSPLPSYVPDSFPASGSATASGVTASGTGPGSSSDRFVAQGQRRGHGATGATSTGNTSTAGTTGNTTHTSSTTFTSNPLRLSSTTRQSPGPRLDTTSRAGSPAYDDLDDLDDFGQYDEYGRSPSQWLERPPSPYLDDLPPGSDRYIHGDYDYRDEHDGYSSEPEYDFDDGRGRRSYRAWLQDELAERRVHG